MTAEKVLRITEKEKVVISDLFGEVCSFVGETRSAEKFADILKDIIECIYYDQSVTDEYEIKIITEKGD